MKLTADQIHAFDFAAKADRWLTVSELCLGTNLSFRGADACARELVQLGLFESEPIAVFDYAELREVKHRAEFWAEHYSDTRPPFYPRHRYRLAPAADRAPFDAALQAHNAQHTMKPSAADIHAAIANMEHEDWIDPELAEHSWFCVLYDPQGWKVSDGIGETPEEATAMTWLLAWAPDMFDPDYANFDDVPFEIPEGWRFELMPPRSKLARGELRRLSKEIRRDLENWADLMIEC